MNSATEDDATGDGAAVRGFARWRRNVRSGRGRAVDGSRLNARLASARSLRTRRSQRDPVVVGDPGDALRIALAENLELPVGTVSVDLAQRDGRFGAERRGELLRPDEFPVVGGVEHPDHARAELPERAPLGRALVDVEHDDDTVDLGRDRAQVDIDLLLVSVEGSFQLVDRLLR